MVGIFEQMNTDNELYSFMTKCSHDKLTGDHYLIIGEHLNKLNKSAVDNENIFTLKISENAENAENSKLVNALLSLK